MRKFLLVILILFLGFLGYVLYDSNKEVIPILKIEEEKINVDELYIYGTHLNLQANTIDGDNLKFILYNGEFIEKNINITNNKFNFSDYINDGLFLDDIPIGSYYLFLRSGNQISDKEDDYKYYAIINNTSYDETVYYTLSKYNKKVIINSEDSYPTMMMTVSKNKDSNIFDVVLDPGHGGIDGGASRYGYSESDWTINLAVKVKNILEQDGIKVKLTHEPGQIDSNKKLQEYGVHGRAVVPYEVSAKYLFSFHMNSSTNSSVNGLEIYAAKNINYNFAKKLVNNLVTNTGLNYSRNNINRIMNGIYSRTFTEDEVEHSINDYKKRDLNPYNISTKSNYYYIIRETGGIITGAYVDNRNDKIDGNPYINSQIGTESYLLELGYISNKNDLDNIKNNIDKYALTIANSIKELC